MSVDYVRVRLVGALVGFGVFALTAGMGFGQGKSPGGGMANLSREEQISRHEKMIGVHTKMVECLKSNKPIQECHQEMKQACSEIHGGPCPMMSGKSGEGRGMMGKGKMRKGKMMNSSTPSVETPSDASLPEKK